MPIERLYEWLRTSFTENAVIQQDPTQIYQDTLFGLYGQRQTIAEDHYCGTASGGDPVVCARLFSVLKQL